MTSPSLDARETFQGATPFRLVALLSVAALWLSIFVLLVSLGHLHEKNTEKDVAQLSHALALQTEQLFQSVEISMQVLAQRLAATDFEPAAMARIIHEMRASLPPYIDFGIFDAQGRGVASTVPGFQVGAPFADRDYFRAHRERADLGLYIAEPIMGRVSKKPVLPLSLRLSDRRGAFVGVLVGTVYTQHLAETYGRFPLGSQGLIVLLQRREPLRVVARWPQHEIYFGRDASAAPVFASIAAGQPKGVARGRGLDGVERIVGWHDVGKRPLSLAAGIALSDLEASRRNEKLILITTGGLLTLLLFALIGALERGRKRQEEAYVAQRLLAETQARDAAALRSAIDMLNRAQRVAKIGSWQIDGATHELTWSLETYRIFGVESHQPLSYEDFLSRVHPEDREKVDAAWRAAMNGAPYDLVHRIVVGGETKWVREQAELKFDEEGKLLLGIGTVQDVTQQVLDQMALEQSRAEAQAADRAKSAFLANMSHEIRTPMNALLGFIELTLGDAPLTPNQRRWLLMAQKAGHSLLVLLNDLIDFSRVEANRLTLEEAPFSVAEVVAEVRDLFAAQMEQKHLAWKAEIAADVPAVVIGDAMRLRQVLVNLVGNAVKFTPSGGVSLYAKALASEDPDRIALEFSVQDTGIGLNPDDSERLFAPFTQGESGTTRRFGGAGLGLAICRRLVTLMSGEIRAFGAPGVGATFRFTIRVKRASEESPCNPPDLVAFKAKPTSSPPLDATPPPPLAVAAATKPALPLAEGATEPADEGRIIRLVRVLHPLLANHEWPQDELLAELAAAVPREPRFARLLELIGNFDHAKALALLEQIASAYGVDFQ
ncbi:MAG: ATP-binding protein [Rhodocyclaceae bacterium]|nr:ATP-binding protein [Rhodocyclaceae bacterium]